jgi:hypothetical protein
MQGAQRGAIQRRDANLRGERVRGIGRLHLFQQLLRAKGEWRNRDQRLGRERRKHLERR